MASRKHLPAAAHKELLFKSTSFNPECDLVIDNCEYLFAVNKILGLMGLEEHQDLLQGLEEHHFQERLIAVDIFRSISFNSQNFFAR